MTHYQGYEDWKGWDRRFAPTDDERAYFAGETDGLRIGGADLLEIGFGAGSFLAWARGAGARVSGTELLESLCDTARDQGVAVLPPDIEAIADRHRDGFDTVVAFDVFEHWTLDEIRRRLDALAVMLRPGGHLLMRFPNAQSPFGLAPQHGDPTHRSFLSRGVFEQLIQGRPFLVVRYGGSFRIESGPPLKRVVRILRHRLRSLIGAVLGAIYATRIPWDPVVVLVLRRTT